MSANITYNSFLTFTLFSQFQSPFSLMRQLLLLLRNKTRTQLARVGYQSPERKHLNQKMEIGKSPRNSDTSGKSSLVRTIMTVGHRFVLLVARCIFRFVYGEKGAAMPPIRDLTLLESATSLAAKIRSKKVKKANNICMVRAMI